MTAPGTIVDGRFEVLSLLGEGGMGVVYQAAQPEMHRTVALKLLKLELASEPEKVARFRNEARVISALSHPHIVQVYSIGLAETGQPYMAMELVRGKSLSSIVAERRSLPYLEALPLFIQICEGLQYAHEQQIIHRDIKPSNVIICTDGDAKVAKIVDFGIAKILTGDGQQLTRTGMAVGSVFYLSPGQMEGRKPDPASDIYALGCSLYEVLAGVPPFQGDSALHTMEMHRSEAPPAVNDVNPNAHIPNSLQLVLDSMMAKHTSGRYSSATHVAQDLHAILNGDSPKFAQQQERPQSRKVNLIPRMNNRLLLGAVGLTLVAVCVVAALYFFSSSRQAAEEEFTTESKIETLLEEATRAETNKDYTQALQPITIAVGQLDKDTDPLLAARVYFESGHISQLIWRLDQYDNEALYERAIDHLQKAIDHATAVIAGSPRKEDRNEAATVRVHAAIIRMTIQCIAQKDISPREFGDSYTYIQTTSGFSSDWKDDYLGLCTAVIKQRLQAVQLEPALEAIAVRARAQQLFGAKLADLKEEETTYVNLLNAKFGADSGAGKRVRAIFAALKQ